MSIKKVSLDQIKYSKGKTSKEVVDDLSDNDINEAALSDADCEVPTQIELDEFGKPKERKND